MKCLINWIPLHTHVRFEQNPTLPEVARLPDLRRAPYESTRRLALIIMCERVYEGLTSSRGARTLNSKDIEISAFLGGLGRVRGH